MKIIKYLTIILCFLLITDNGIAAQPNSSTQTAISLDEVVDVARAYLPQEGQLIQKSDGFVYLKVDDEYIHFLLPISGLTEDGFKEPPYFRSKEATGAHISVIYADENVIPVEVGQTFSFELKQIVIVKANKTTSYAVLQVDSPELEKLREKYGLSPKLHGHEFHISIGKRTTHR